MKLVWLANPFPWYSLLSPLWFADFWTSVTHDGRENQRLTLVTPTLGTPLSARQLPPTLLHPSTDHKREGMLRTAWEHPESHSQLSSHLHCSPLFSGSSP